MKILVVDDSKTMLRIIGNTLKRLGHEDVHTAEDGEKGFELFELHDFDLIMTDQNMPIMTGTELVEKIRIIDKSVPIIMITTESGKKEVVSAIKKGVNSYIAKPFTPDVLKKKLEHIMGRIRPKT